MSCFTDVSTVPLGCFVVNSRYLSKKISGNRRTGKAACLPKVAQLEVTGLVSTQGLPARKLGLLAHCATYCPRKMS